MRRKLTLLLLVIGLAAVALLPALCGGTSHDAPVILPRIVAEYPHDPEAFTQGLFLHKGPLYESTGQYGSSTIRISEPETGNILVLRHLGDEHFGEGVARLGDAAVQLTWKEGVGLIYDLRTLEPLSSFRYVGEGWGLASSPDGLVRSDGTGTLTFLAGGTLAPVRTIEVFDGSRPVASLNELEWMDARILANIWLRDEIVIIDPEDGAVLGWIDLSPLRERLRSEAGAANGIAYDPQAGRLLVTGKNWDKTFEIELSWWPGP